MANCSGLASYLLFSKRLYKLWMKVFNNFKDAVQNSRLKSVQILSFRSVIDAMF